MTEALDLLRRYLATLADPEAGAEHLALHAADALVVVDGEPRAREGVDGAAFAEAHRAAATALLAEKRGFPADAREAEATWHPEGADVGVAVLRLDDPARATPMWAAAGLRQDADGWRVAWALLDEAPPPTAFAVGKAAAIAEFIFLESQQGLPTRGWLDVAYRRRFRFARPALQILPGERFSCHGTGSCCKNYWQIDAPLSAQALIDAMPWAEIGAPHLVGYRMPAKSEDRLFVKQAGETCPFLDENTRCRIHATIGTPVFSACVAFPFRFTETPDGVAVTNSFHCESVRNNLGPTLEERQDDVYRRLNQSGIMGAPAAFRFTPEVEVGWEDFQAIEERLKAALADASLPVFRRLWVASRSLEAIAEGQAPAPDMYATEAIPPLQDFEVQVVETFAPFLLACLGKLGHDLAPLLTARPRSTELHDPERVARWLRMLHHGKDYAYKYDLVTAHTVSVVLYVAVLALEADHGGPLGETAWGRIGTAASHNSVIRVLDEIFKSAEFMRTELAAPQAGATFLRWAAHLAAEAEAPQPV